jgi:hypothetical protein
MRLIIDIDPIKGTSMRAEGPLSPLLILDTLMQQFHAYWGVVWKQIGNGIVTPGGMPTAITKETDEPYACDGFESASGDPLICRYCGDHYGNHPKGGPDADNGATS